MKIIKKIFLAVVMLFAFASCMSSPINLTGSVAPINSSQKKILVAYYPEHAGKWRSDLETSFGIRKWKINEISFWEVEQTNLRKRSETFLIVVDKMIKENRQSMLGGTFFSGNISVYDLRTGNKIINYNLSTEESFDVTTRLAKALGGLVTK
ncbi:hypothetical protein [Fusobacterium polymorphum]|uniref:hypothetical protein n=1 Tax=Fusobacterium nucleatum subsp. polymorphum TaxID=76857 RepID=UPI001EF0B7B6|nr:hypothetical protein [Fusobacterium nucleatum]MCG6839589.1 hypothetical protein [Fusobacterium nucleatum]